MSRMSHQNCFLRAKECQHKIVTGQSSCRAWQCCRPPESASPRALWPTSLRQRGLDWNDENGFRGAVWIAALRDRFATECDQLWSFNAFMNIFWILVNTRAKVILLLRAPCTHYLNAKTLLIQDFMLIRFLTEDVWISGYLFPKNTNVMASISSIHYNPENWPEPERFNPDRFLDETGKFVAPKSGFVPFSVGKRFCLGQSLAEKEFFLFFAGLMQKFEFRAPKSGSLPNIVFQDDDENIGFVRQPDKYLVDVKLRN